MAKGRGKVKIEKEREKIKGKKKGGKELFSRAAGSSADDMLPFVGSRKDPMNYVL